MWIVRNIGIAACLYLLILFPPLTTASEVVKCKSPSGKIIYSDVPCEKQGASQTGMVDTSPNELSGGAPTRSPRQPSYAPVVSGSADQVPYVNGYIGNRPVRFMMDTGASEISIPHRRAVELGIPVFSGQRAESLTASGRVGVYKMRLESVTVGNVTVRNVAAHVSLNETGNQDILLGMSFLKHVNLVMRKGVVSIGP